MTKKKEKARAKSYTPVVNLKRLRELGRLRGFSTSTKLADHLATVTGNGKPSTYRRKLANSTFTYGDVCLVSDALNFTAAEFLSVWFPGMFTEDEDGTVVFRLLPKQRELLITRTWNGDQERNRRLWAKRRGESRGDTMNDVKDFLENFTE